MPALYQKPDDITSVFRSLGEKFARHVDQSLAERELKPMLTEVELKARAFWTVAEILRKTANPSNTQQHLLNVFGELFANTICSLFLAASALDTAAQMVLRRVLELGLSVVYLWDLPHRFWGWKTLDQDITYKEMVEHINSPAYKAYLFPTKTVAEVSDLIDSATANALYRRLSNTVYAKLATFETSVPDCFSYNKVDWTNHLTLVNNVEDLLLRLWRARFPEVSSNLSTQMPQLARLA